MKSPWWLVLLLPTYLLAQPSGPYRLDLSNTVVSLDSLSFNVAHVVDRTGITDGIYGQAYTGLMNRPRPLTIKNGLELSVLTSLLRGVTDPGRPAVTLEIHHLRIEETIKVTGENRHLQLSASLRCEQADGAQVHYGPYQVTDVQWAVDATLGHPRALAVALREALTGLDHLLREGITGMAPTYTATGIPEMADGALYSVADYRNGRVDTSLQLQFVGQYVVGDRGGTVFHQAHFAVPHGRKHYRELWGYHNAGITYRYLQDNFYEIGQDTIGNTFIIVPGGLIDGEEYTKRAATNTLLFGVVGALVTTGDKARYATDVYNLDISSGALSPVFDPTLTRPVTTSPIILYHVSEDQTFGLTIEVNGTAHSVPAGTYLTVEQAAAIVLTASHGKAKPYYRDISPATPDEPTLYQIAIDDRGRITFLRENQARAREVATAIAAGDVRPASAAR